MKLRRLIWLLFLPAVLLSCTKEPRGNDPTDPTDPTNPNAHADAAANKWILGIMQDQYLYNKNQHILGVIASPNYNQSSETFFNSLLSDSPSDNDGKHPDRYGNSKFYSYMERPAASATKAGNTFTYGLQFVLQEVSNIAGGSVYIARVIYVLPGSVAKTAGMKRGDWITNIGSEQITQSNYTKLQAGLGVSLTVCNDATVDDGVISFGNKRTVVLPGATMVNESPVFFRDVIDAGGGHKIAYLVYNSFDLGNKSTVNGPYDNQMKEAFAWFKSKGATDVVVDLRYNGGGFVSCCQLMASMILPVAMLPTSDIDNVKIFARGEYNADRTAKGDRQTFRFIKRGDIESYNLNLQPGAHIIVLTGNWTASASELLINGLNPYIGGYAADGKVRYIGRETEGKNVASYEVSNSQYNMSLHPITMKLYNKNNESNYAQGFTPEAGDLKNEFNAGDGDAQINMRELGDPEEYILRYAIAAITGIPVAASQTSPLETKSTVDMRVMASTLDNRPIQGAIVTQD